MLAWERRGGVANFENMAWRRRKRARLIGGTGAGASSALVALGQLKMAWPVSWRPR